MIDPTPEDRQEQAVPGKAADDAREPATTEPSDQQQAQHANPYDEGAIPEDVDEYAAERGGYGVSVETG